LPPRKRASSPLQSSASWWFFFGGGGDIFIFWEQNETHRHTLTVKRRVTELLTQTVI